MRNTIYEFDAIGTRWWCELLDDSNGFSQALIDEVARICAEFDQRYSRFRDDSLVMELFRTGKLIHPPEEVVRMFAYAHEMYRATDGAFDISVGATLHRLGYGKREHGGNIPVNIWESIEYSAKVITAPKGIMLDFGGQGKGWLIDVLVNLFRRHGIDQFIINGGGDLYVASKKPVEIVLEDPGAPGSTYGHVNLMNEALAASSTSKRVWEHASRQYHHIIDPANNAPTGSGVMGTFIKAPTATLADTTATILIVRPDLVDSLKARYPIEALIVR